MVATGKQPMTGSSSSRPIDYSRDEALAHELQLMNDMEMAAQLQAQLDGEIAAELADEMSALEVSEQQAAATRTRIERNAWKEITHLGKGTARNICDTMKIGPSLCDLLRLCRDESKRVQVVSLVDAGQRDRVHAEIVSLLADEELGTIINLR